jgi:hypothetical protein
MQNITDLRETLFDTIERLKNDKMDVSTANAISQVAGRIIETAKVENEFLQFTQQKNSVFFPQLSNSLNWTKEQEDNFCDHVGGEDDAGILAHCQYFHDMYFPSVPVELLFAKITGLLNDRNTRTEVKILQDSKPHYEWTESQEAFMLDCYEWNETFEENQSRFEHWKELMFPYRTVAEVQAKMKALLEVNKGAPMYQLVKEPEEHIVRILDTKEPEKAAEPGKPEPPKEEVKKLSTAIKEKQEKAEPAREWTAEEDKRLKNYYVEYGADRIQKVLLRGRTVDEIEVRALLLGVKKKTPKPTKIEASSSVNTGSYEWHSQDDEVLLENYPKMTTEDLIEEYFPGVPADEIKMRYGQLSVETDY